MIDIDQFKGINDGYGHLAGDNALKEVAQRVEAQIRSMDTAARFGGDELAILLPEATRPRRPSSPSASAKRIAAEPFALTAQIKRTLTVSVGVAAVSPGRHEADLKAVADRLIADADAALYRAKALGRNRVQVGSRLMWNNWPCPSARHRLHRQGRLSRQCRHRADARRRASCSSAAASAAAAGSFRKAA